MQNQLISETSSHNLKAQVLLKAQSIIIYKFFENLALLFAYETFGTQSEFLVL